MERAGGEAKLTFLNLFSSSVNFFVLLLCSITAHSKKKE